MELKNYQKTVMNNLSSYLECVNTDNSVIAAWKSYWLKQDVNVGFAPKR